MTKFYLRKYLLFIGLILMIPGMIIAQGTGTLKGSVVDAINGEPLPGANVVVKSIFLGTASQLNGEFVLNKVPAGSNAVTISYLGYVEKEITVNITAGETESVNIELEVLSIQGEEVVITAQAYGQRAAINQQLAANTVINVVSSEKIEELPDANAAEAIGRLPGISLKRNSGEASQVVIRGLSPKYNNVMIEGIRMASTSDFDRSVDLSLIQSESLAGIEVSKSLRPDMDADALGGTVNLRLKEASNKRKIRFAAEGGYANLGKDFANYKFSGGISDRFFDKKFGASLNVSHEQKQMPSHRFSGGYQGAYTNFLTDEMGEITDTVLLTRTQNASLTDHLQKRKRTNASLILDYKSDWWTVKFFNLLSIKNDDVLSRRFQYIFNPQGTPANFSSNVNETLWKTMTRTHTLQNTFRFGASKLDVDLSTTYAERSQTDQGFPFIESNDYSLNQDWLVYRQPKEAIDFVGGVDSLKIEDSYLQGLDIGDMMLTDQSYDARIDYELAYAFGSVTGKLQLGGKYHKLTRASYGTSENFSFQWGGSVARRQAFIAQYNWITTDLQAQRGISAHNFIDEDYDPGKFLNGRYEAAWTGDVDLLTDIQEEWRTDPDNLYFQRGVQSYERDYEATEELYAGYIMTEINIGRKLMLLPGVRYERNATEYFAYHIKTNDGQTGIEPNPDSVITNRENVNWYPSLNLKFKVTDYLSIQGAVYKSTSRPSFRQISPLVIYRHNSTNITSNNPYLTPSTAWNFDLGVSLMKSKIGLLTVYGFYKQIDDLAFTMNNYKPIKKGQIVGGPDDLDDRLLGEEYYEAYYIDDQQGTTNLPFNNTERAFVTGLELSWQTSFWYLPGVLKGLVLDVNYTILDTRTKYPFFSQVIIDVDSSGFIPQPIYGQEYETRDGPMQDQPASILNIIVGWDYKGFSARVSYRYQSRTVEGLDSKYSIFDRYYDTFSLVDVMLKQKITKNISAYANLTNIGNHIDDYYFGEQGDKPALPTNSQFYGFRAQVGVRVNL